MGIKDFSKAFKACRTIANWNLYKGKIIAIDAMTEIWRSALGAKSVKTLSDADNNPTIHINVIMANIIKMQKSGVKTIWVFDHDQDGSCTEHHIAAKSDEVAERRKKRAEAKAKIEDLEKEEPLFSDDDSDDESKDNKDSEKQAILDKQTNKQAILDKQTNKQAIQQTIQQQEKRAFCVSKEMINDIKFILTCLNISYVEAPASFEGEHLAAYFTSSEVGLADAVYSGDTDPIPFGAPILLRKNPRDKKIYEYRQTDILDQIHEVIGDDYDYPTIDDIRKICAILGSDYSKRTKGIGAKTVLRKYKVIKLAADQKTAISEFEKIPDISDITVHNNQYEAFTNTNVDLLVDWLVNNKSFAKSRVLKWIEDVMEKNEQGVWTVKEIKTNTKSVKTKTSTKNVKTKSSTKSVKTKTKRTASPEVPLKISERRQQAKN